MFAVWAWGLLPEESADAAPVAEPLASRGNTGGHGWARREVEQDGYKKHPDRRQLCHSTETLKVSFTDTVRHSTMWLFLEREKGQHDISEESSEDSLLR